MEIGALVVKKDFDIILFEGMHEYIYTDFVVIDSKKLLCRRPLRLIT